MCIITGNQLYLTSAKVFFFCEEQNQICKNVLQAASCMEEAIITIGGETAFLIEIALDAILLDNEIFMIIEIMIVIDRFGNDSYT